MDKTQTPNRQELSASLPAALEISQVIAMTTEERAVHIGKIEDRRAALLLSACLAIQHYHEYTTAPLVEFTDDSDLNRDWRKATQREYRDTVCDFIHFLERACTDKGESQYFNALQELELRIGWILHAIPPLPSHSKNEDPVLTLLAELAAVWIKGQSPDFGKRKKRARRGVKTDE